MKKIILSFLAIILGGAVYAQSPVLIYEGRELVHNEVITISTVDPILGIMQAKLSVKNPSSSSITAKVRRSELSIVEGSENYFCFGQCYTPEVSESGQQLMDPGEILPDFFYADYEPSTQKGTSIIRYDFYNITNPKNANSVIVHFSDGNSWMKDYLSDNYVKVYSNSGNTVSIAYNLQEQQELIICDITGKFMGKQLLEAGKTTAKLAFPLHSGIYIYSTRGIDGALFSGKFIVFE